MLEYLNSVHEDDVTYSVDMVRLRLEFNETNMQVFGDWLSGVNCFFVESFPVSYKAYAYRNLFHVTCSNNNSFVVGLGFNGTTVSDYLLGFMEFNPNKVANQKEFQLVMDKLRKYCFCAELSRWDLAVDVPFAREQCHLRKDKRKYSLLEKSKIDRTENLGQRNKVGYVKLYNKRIESELDYELTRLEITLDGQCTYKDFLTYLPRIDVDGDQQTINPYVELSGTNLVLYELLMEHDLLEREHYMRRIGRRIAEQLRPYVYGSKYDSDKFVVSRNVFLQLKKQLREYTINIRYDLSDNL